MDLKSLASDLAKLTPEERASLAVLFTGGAAPAAGEEIPEVDLELFEQVKGDMRKMYPRLDDARITRLAAEAMKQKKERRPPKPPRAEMVYFFQQNSLFVSEKIEMDEETEQLKKTGYYLPPRVIAVDDKSAGKLFWKQRNKYGYIGRSTGHRWAQARADGMSVSEAFAVEYEEFKKNPDQTPPANREKTFFAGTKPHMIARGHEISWKAGLKQQGGE